MTVKGLLAQKTNDKSIVENMALESVRVIQYLQKTYPKVFNPSQFKPLKKGIIKDILKHAEFPFSEKCLQEALHIYIFSSRYLKCFQIYSERYDLEGNPCDIIREIEKKYGDYFLYPLA